MTATRQMPACLAPFRQKISVAAGALTAALLVLGPVMPVSAQTPAGILAPGNAAVTGFSGAVPPAQIAPGADPADQTFIDLDGPSMRIVDLQDMGGPPHAQLVEAAKPYTASARQVGQVFAVALDNAVPPNIYLAATSSYGLPIVVPGPGGSPARAKVGAPGATFMAGLWGPAEQSGGPGSIWKIDGTTGAVTLFANVALDGAPNSGPALGGLAYDPTSKSLYVADRGTGMIHRFGMDGAELGRFDHGTAGRAAAGLPPVAFDPAQRLDITKPQFDSEQPATWGYAPAERLIYGLGVRADRLYYAVADGLQIWSVALSEDGQFGNDARREIDVPPAAAPTEISKITFDQQGRMFLGERPAPTGAYDFAALTQEGIGRVLRYALVEQQPDAAPAWQPAPDEYAIGFPLALRNANGGVALGYTYDLGGAIDRSTCGGYVWSTGEQLRRSADAALAAQLAKFGSPNVDGLQGNPVELVRPDNVPPLRTYFIDYDDHFDDEAARGHMGDIAIWRVCGPVMPGGWMPPGWLLGGGWFDDDDDGGVPSPPLSKACPGSLWKPGFQCCPKGMSLANNGTCKAWCPNGATDPKSKNMCAMGFDSATWDPNDPSKLRCIGGSVPVAGNVGFGCVQFSPVLSPVVCMAGWSKQPVANIGTVCQPTKQQKACPPGQQVSNIDNQCHKLCAHGNAWPTAQCCAPGAVVSGFGKCCAAGSTVDPKTGACKPPASCPLIQTSSDGKCCPVGSAPNNIIGGCCPQGQTPEPGTGVCTPDTPPPPPTQTGCTDAGCCSQGQTFDPATKTCKPPPTQTGCTDASCCAKGQTFDPATKSCKPSLAMCPAGQQPQFGVQCCPLGQAPGANGKCISISACPGGQPDPHGVCKLGVDPATYDPTAPGDMRCLGGSKPDFSLGLYACAAHTAVLGAPVCPVGWAKTNVSKVGTICWPTKQALSCLYGQQLSPIDNKCHWLCATGAGGIVILGGPYAWPTTQCCAIGSVISVTGKCCPAGSTPDPKTGSCTQTCTGDCCGQQGQNYDPTAKIMLAAAGQPRLLFAGKAPSSSSSSCCEPGQTWNPLTKTCTKKLTSTGCGEDLYPSNGGCCEKGLTYDPVAKTCKKTSPPGTVCSGEDLYPSNGGCCEKGQTYNPVTKTCKAIDCPLPGKKDSTGYCCTPNDQLPGNKCGIACAAGSKPYMSHHVTFCCTGQVIGGKCCAAGQSTADGKLCCPAGTKPGGGHDIQCVKVKDPSGCTTGYTYDPVSKTCKKSSTSTSVCPSGTVASNGGCCKQGLTYDPVTKTCKGQLSDCPPPGKKDSTGYCCSPDEQKPGGKCAPTCDPKLATTIGGGTDAKPACCPVGQVPNSVLGGCCPAGTTPATSALGTWFKGACIVPQPTCPSGTVLSSGQCCKPDDFNPGGKCNPASVICPPGQKAADGSCCQPGAEPDPQSGPAACKTKTIVCAPGQTMAGDKTGAICCPPGSKPGPNGHPICNPDGPAADVQKTCSKGYTRMPDNSCCADRLVSRDKKSCGTTPATTPPPPPPPPPRPASSRRPTRRGHRRRLGRRTK